jgi:hypothetical protein
MRYVRPTLGEAPVSVRGPNPPISDTKLSD